VDFFSSLLFLFPIHNHGPGGFQADLWHVLLQPLGWYGGIYETLSIIGVAQLALLPVITAGDAALGVFLRLAGWCTSVC
jgi:hypothetical protein